MKKRIVFVVFLLSSLSAVFAEDADMFADIDREIAEQNRIEQEAASQKDSWSLFSGFAPSLFFTLAPNLMINTDDATESAPSPIMYSLGVGGNFSFSSGILFQTHLSFFTNYYLWDGDDAQPAEVENRTSTALSFMFDVCTGYVWRFGSQKQQSISLAGGAGLFLRYGILSNGVAAEDENRTTGTSASDDVSEINDWFYRDLHFFYPEIALSYAYAISDTWSVGAQARVYIPLGSLLNGTGLDDMIVSLGVTLAYK